MKPISLVEFRDWLLTKEPHSRFKQYGQGYLSCPLERYYCDTEGERISVNYICQVKGDDVINLSDDCKQFISWADTMAKSWEEITIREALQECNRIIYGNPQAG